MVIMMHFVIMLDALNGVIDGWFTELPKIYNGIVINNTTLNEELDV